MIWNIKDSIYCEKPVMPVVLLGNTSQPGRLQHYENHHKQGMPHLPFFLIRAHTSSTSGTSFSMEVKVCG